MSNGTFSTLNFATIRERKGRDCRVAKTIYFNTTKLLRPGNIANGVQNPICHFEPQWSPSKQSQLSEVDLRSQVSKQREGKRERQVMPPLVLLIKFVPLLIIFQVSFSFNLLVAN